MTDRELMKQALEALEANPAELHDEWGGPDNGRRAVEIIQSKAITALREALSQPERQPLTDTQIEQCMKEAYATVQGRNLEHAFARAIERAHGIGKPKDGEINEARTNQ